MFGKVVIYTRYSSDMQRPQSCRDQERNARQALNAKGIDHSNALVLDDEAIPGTREDRPSYLKLMDMVKAKEVAVLAVDDQSRLSRGDLAKAFITDVVFSGGRFISATEGIDTANPGWKASVGLREIEHSLNNENKSNQVRRGIAGRVLTPQGSAGDHPFGYVSDFESEDWAEEFKHGRRPSRIVKIDPITAAIVREIFRLFVEELWTINRIARKFNELGVPKGPRARTKTWTRDCLRSILRNEKYTGRWTWGRTMLVTDSTGRKRALRAPQSRHVTMDRPDLRIIDEDTWQRAQRRMVASRASWDKHIRNGASKSTFLLDHRYRAHALAGLICCGRCGMPMSTTKRKNGPQQFFCRQRLHGVCGMGGYARVDSVRNALAEFLKGICLDCPAWLQEMDRAMRERLQALASAAPVGLQRMRDQLAQARTQMDNLVTAITQGGSGIQALTSRLATLESEAQALEASISRQEALARQPLTPPDPAWMRQQLQQLSELLRENTPRAAQAWRAIFTDVRLFRVPRPGKKKFCNLVVRFRISGFGLLMQDLGPELAARVREALSLSDQAGKSDNSPEFTLAVTRLTPEQRHGAAIGRLRAQGMQWGQVAQKIGLSKRQVQRIYLDYKRLGL